MLVIERITEGSHTLMKVSKRQLMVRYQGTLNAELTALWGMNKRKMKARMANGIDSTALRQEQQMSHVKQGKAALTTFLISCKCGKLAIHNMHFTLESSYVSV